MSFELTEAPGWVSYATSAINSAVGECKLMPAADTPCTIVNADTGQSRGNGSWVLGRMMRDFEYWMGDRVEEKVEEMRLAKWKFDQEQANKRGEDPAKVHKAAHAGLVVSFWNVDEQKSKSLAKPGKDILFWSGIFIYIVQMGVAAIPFGLNGSWGVFLVTGAAILLCLATGAGRQWKREKWACRVFGPKDKPRSYIMTRGNGAQHAIVINCHGYGLNLEDLCTGFDNLDSPAISVATRLVMVVLGVLWILLLITSSALTADAWYLIAVGGIGMLQNIFVAGWSRTPDALGLPLAFQDVVGYPKVFDAIVNAEKHQHKIGRALVGIFFPAGLRDNEEAKLGAVEADWKRRKTEDQRSEAMKNDSPKES